MADTRAKRIRERYGVKESVFQEALAAGVDPRSVEALRKESEAMVRNATATGFSGIAMRSIYRQRGSAKDLTLKTQSEVAKIPELEAIRERRKQAVEETIQSLSRKRGKASLLSSQAGGAGFFSGYFN